MAELPEGRNAYWNRMRFGRIDRTEATEIFNNEARKIAKESARAGEPIDSPENRARLDRFSEELARRMKPSEASEGHMTRNMHRRMRGMTRGAEMNPAELTKLIRELKAGHKLSKGPGGSRSLRGPLDFRNLRQVTRLRADPAGLVAAGYAGYRVGQELLDYVPESVPVLGAHRRRESASAKAEMLEDYEGYLRSEFPDMSGAFYRGMSRQMLLEEQEGYTPDPASIRSITDSMSGDFEEPQPYDGLDEPVEVAKIEHMEPIGENFLQQQGFLDAADFLQYWGQEDANYGITEDEDLLGDRIEPATIEGLNIRITKRPGE